MKPFTSLEPLRKLTTNRKARRRVLLGLFSITALLLGLVLEKQHERELARSVLAERAASWRSPVKPAAAPAGAALSLQADSALRLAAELAAREQEGFSLQRAQLRRAEGGRFELKGE